ncbi:bifunctional metallophosphatase/5'-nucleotidase [Breznakiellaceae bacterium SP9]
MRKMFLAFVAAFSLLGLGACGSAGEGAASTQSEFIVLHTNDHHGAVLPNSSGQGGLAERAAFIKQVRDNAKGPVFVVDAGDINTGSAISNTNNAEPDIVAYNLMGYDLATFGNHEFDGSLDTLLKQIDLADFPYISSNIKTADGRFLGGHQYIVRELPGLQIGFFGLTTLRTKVIASPDASLTFIDEIAAAREVVDILRNEKKVAVVIGLVHLGDVKESDDHITSIELAQAVPGIDFLVDGHSHSLMENPIVVTGPSNDTYIASANEYGKYVGVAKFAIKDGVTIDVSWEPVEISKYAPDPAVVSLLKPYIDKAKEELGEVVGHVSQDFPFEAAGKRLTRYQETAIGNLITDLNAWYFRTVKNEPVDFVFHNGGNIRTGLTVGDTTLEKLYTMLPFTNYLYIASLKGSDIIELFDFIATIKQGAGGFPQFSSEVRYTIDYNQGHVTALTIGGTKVDAAKTYRFATNDYLIRGGDGYTVLKKATDINNTSILLVDTVAEAFKTLAGGTSIRVSPDISIRAPVSPYLDGRLKVIGSNE